MKKIWIVLIIILFVAGIESAGADPVPGEYSNENLGVNDFYSTGQVISLDGGQFAIGDTANGSSAGGYLSISGGIRTTNTIGDFIDHGDGTASRESSNTRSGGTLTIMGDKLWGQAQGTTYTASCSTTYSGTSYYHNENGNWIFDYAFGTSTLFGEFDNDPFTIISSRDMYVDNLHWDSVNNVNIIDYQTSNTVMTIEPRMEKVLYDDFSSGRLDQNKWENQPASRLIVSNKLYTTLSSKSGWARNRTTFLNPETINTISCEMTIDSMSVDTGNNTHALSYVGGVFYNSDSSSTGVKGNVWAYIVIAERGEGLEVNCFIQRTDDDDWNNSTTIADDVLIQPGIIQAGTSYNLGISWDGSNGFTFWIQGPSDAQSASLNITGPEFVRNSVGGMKGFHLGINSDSSTGQGSVAATIDNIFINNSDTVFDDFSSDYLDPLKWDAELFSRTFENGKIRLETMGDHDSSEGKSLRSKLWLDTYNASYVEAKLQISSNSYLQSYGGEWVDGEVRIAGNYYNDTYNGNYNGYEGDVWVSLRLRLRPDGMLEAVSRGYRSTSADWSSDESVDELRHTFAKTIEFDTEYILSIDFDGKTFVFAVGDEIFAHTLTGNVFTPFGESRVIEGKIWFESGGAEGHMIVTADDVYVDQTSAGAVNQPPDTPALLSPADNATDVSLTPDLTISSFSDPDPNDTHTHTLWQISTSDDFITNIFYEKSRVHLAALPIPDLIFQENTTYYWRTMVYDSKSNSSQWSDIFSFTTHTTQNDLNENGIPDDSENQTADLDNDGTADIEQTGEIKTLNTVIGDGQMGASIKDSENITSITEIRSIDPDSISHEARPQSMPLGLFGFRLTLENPGDTAEVVIYFSEPAPDNAVWYMHDTVNGWTDYSEYSEFSQDRMSVTVRLKDGDYGDTDGIANGIIVDPCGYGIASWITGLVSDVLTSASITTATISFDELDMDLNTLLDGKYISMIQPGTYRLSISAPGYESQSVSSLEIAEGSIVTKDIELAGICQKASLVSPSGTGSDLTPEFTWNEDLHATWYQLWIGNSSGSKTFAKWYTSSEACSNGSCSVTLESQLSDNDYKWWIQTWNDNSTIWSDSMSFTISSGSGGLPSAATLVSSSYSSTDQATFTWNAVSNSTWYYLWVDDSTGNRIKKWYTAADCGCESGSTCSITPDTSLTGNSTWWIRTWNDTGFGPWSSGMNFTAAGSSGNLPGAASLTSPSGSISGTDPTYTWNAVSGSTYYYLWVDDSAGNKIKTWYTASECGCESASTCSVTPGTTLSAGSHTWWIQTWNNSGNGDWSSSMNFNISN